MNAGTIALKCHRNKQLPGYRNGYEMRKSVYEWKLSCTVLRRGEAGTHPLLNRRLFNIKKIILFTHITS